MTAFWHGPDEQLPLQPGPNCILPADDETYITALIYPAEHDDAFSRWLLDGHYRRTSGAVEGGTGSCSILLLAICMPAGFFDGSSYGPQSPLDVSGRVTDLLQAVQ